MGVTSLWASVETERVPEEASQSRLWEWLKERLDFSKYVPQPREGVVSREFEEKKGTYYVLRSPTGQYMKMDPTNYYLWSQMDGDKTVTDLAVAYFFKFHTFIFARLRTLVASLRQKGFLADRPAFLYARVMQRLHGGGIAAWGNRIVQTFLQREFAIRGLDGIVTKLSP